jgi:hypothetical protein
LSIGADVQYNFGQINTQNISSRYDANGLPIQYSSKEENKSIVNGANVTTGISYQSKLNNKINLFTSATYSPASSINLTNSRAVSLVQTVNGFEAVLLVGDPVSIEVPSTKLILPSKLTFGVGIGDSKKWIIGTELEIQNSSNFGNRFADITNVSYQNSTKFTLGGYYIPNYKSFTNYLSRIVYRGGLRYENTGLVINNTAVKDAALTLGMGLPLRGVFSNVNIGFEYGNRGTTNAGLVNENYMNVRVGLSLNDRWFVKSKYD